LATLFPAITASVIQKIITNAITLFFIDAPNKLSIKKLSLQDNQTFFLPRNQGE